MAVKLEVIPEGDTKLIIRHEPSYVRSYILGLLTLWGAGFYFLFPSSGCLFYIVILFLLALILALTARKLETVMDKTNGQVIRKRGGWLGSNLGEKETHFLLSETKSLEIQRYIKQYGDGFQIKLLFESGNRIELSTRDLGYKEAHEFANHIQQFLGKGIPLALVDWKFTWV